MNNNKILQLCRSSYGKYPSEITPIPGGGSSRRYCRLVFDDGNTLIAAEGDDVAENRTFCRLSEALRPYEVSCGRFDFRVPMVYGISKEGDIYIQEDLGNTSLYDIILKVRKDPGLETTLHLLVEESILGLVALQSIPLEVIEKNVGYPEFSELLVGWDLNYFKYCFLKPSGVQFDEFALEDDFTRLKESFVRYDERLKGFMYRDFQSRNIMIVKEECVKSGESSFKTVPAFIDYQGGRVGPMVYDLVSFLWQSRAGFSPEIRKRASRLYALILYNTRGVDPEEVFSEIRKFKLLRTLQVLGAYGFRGLIERKAQFLESIAATMDNLRECINEGSLDDYPELLRCCRNLIADRRWEKDTLRSSEPRLTVEVFSFSYKKGYPEDYSGNGGGFVFDCRGMHNPGRYPEYKHKTGRDIEVIEFLEQKGEVADFLKGAYMMIDHTVETYLRRGFTNLQIGFGCTGGQHRSVYCAEHTARHIAALFPGARVILRHREQGIEEVFNA